MNNLQSIDLTQDYRFGRMIDEEVSKKLKIEDRGIHRLKKGEIPHLSISYNTNNIITTSNTFTDWIVNTTDVIEFGNADLLDNSIRNNITIDSGPTVVNNITITDQSTLFTWVNDWTAGTSNISSYYYLSDNNSAYKKSWKHSTLNTNGSIADRIRIEPFDTPGYDGSNNDIIYRLKQHKSLKTFEVGLQTLYNRLGVFNEFNPFSKSNTDYALSRIRDIDDDAVSLPTFDTFIGRHNDIKKQMELNLKRKAPFIKRVYITNRGHSFDSKEFQFDMVLAEEHFNNAIRQH